MEEDIKQLEELILDRKSFVIGDKEHDEIYLKDISAIENLIKGYQKPEIENQSYRDYFGEPPCYDNASYIPKSEVKEKIEEKQKRINKMHPASDCVLIDDLENQIEVLQELLEDK